MATFFGVLRVFAFGLPPSRPLALAAWSPALVRSRIRSRSNSAREAKILKMSLPLLVVVSILSVRLLNPIFLLLRLVMVSSKCLSDLPKRSSRHNNSNTYW